MVRPVENHAVAADRRSDRTATVSGPTGRLVDAAIWVFALVAVALFRIIDSTLDLRVFNHEHVSAVLRTRRPFLVVVWHGRGLLPIFFFQGYPLVVYSSQTRVGPTPTLSRYIRKLTLASLRHLGYQVLDASTFSTEARGVIRFLQYLERGSGGLIAADGPGGPMFRAKPGAAYVAKKTGISLLPVAAAIRDAIALDSWDQFEIPRPFTKAVLAIGEAIDVPEEIGDEELANLSARLESLLNDLTAQADVEAFASPRL